MGGHRDGLRCERLTPADPAVVRGGLVTRRRPRRLLLAVRRRGGRRGHRRDAVAQPDRVTGGASAGLVPRRRPARLCPRASARSGALHVTTDIRVVDGPACRAPSSPEAGLRRRPSSALPGRGRRPICATGRAEPRSLASVSAEELDRSVADHALSRRPEDAWRTSRGHMFVWTPAAGTVEQAEAQASSHRVVRRARRTPSGLRGTASLSPATVWRSGSPMGGILGSGGSGGTTVGADMGAFALAEGTGTPRVSATTGFCGPTSPARARCWSSAGAREGIAPRRRPNRSARRSYARSPCGCPCPSIAGRARPVRSPRRGRRTDRRGRRQRRRPAGRSGRSAAHGDTAPLTARSAQLAGGDLVVSLEGELRHYDAATGALLGTRPVAAGQPLQDAARGLAAYIADGQVRVLRFADGDDAASSQPARRPASPTLGWSTPMGTGSGWSASTGPRLRNPVRHSQAHGAAAVSARLGATAITRPTSERAASIRASRRGRSGGPRRVVRCERGDRPRRRGRGAPAASERSHRPGSACAADQANPASRAGPAWMVCRRCHPPDARARGARKLLRHDAFPRRIATRLPLPMARPAELRQSASRVRRPPRPDGSHNGHRAA